MAFDPEPMDEDELLVFLQNKIDSAMNDEDGELSDNRARSLDYYLGRPYGDERVGYSKVTTRESMETVEWILPSIMRVFGAGERFVEFEPEGRADIEAAQQDTDVVNHILLRQNFGWVQMYQWAKDALMYPNGYAKIWPEEREWIETKRFSGITAGQKAALLEDGWEITEEEEEETVVDVDGVVQPLKVYELTAEKRCEKVEIKWQSVPGDEVLVDDGCNSWNLDEAGFVAHRRPVPFTTLVEMGCDPDRLSEIGNAEDHDWSDERVGRQYTDDENPANESTDDDSMRQYWVEECYVRVDFDGDGLAEHRYCLKIGNELFANDVVDFQPFCSLTSILMPHRHPGLSMNDAVMDLQRIKSTLTRLVLDNAYRINTGRTYIDENAYAEQTTELMQDAQATMIPVQGPPQNAVFREQHQPITQEMLSVIKYFDEDTVIRTGVAPGMALDPKVLQQSTEGAFAEAMTKASERIELIVRLMAETGVKQLCLKAHALARAHVDRDLVIQLRGEFIETNPSAWRERASMTVNVGLGFNNKERMTQLLGAILQEQKEMLGLGMVDMSHIRHTFAKMIENADVGHVDSFVPPAEGRQPPQAPPDPVAMASAQLSQQQLQLAQRQQEHLERMDQMRFQLDAAQAQRDAQMKAMDQRLKGMELMLKRQAQAFESALTQAQTAKAAEEARSLDIENDAAESGVTEALEGVTRALTAGSGSGP
ncbi:MAG: hypothetical protein V2J24_23605 [Pseudomonadales bacterium]|jgi:hypothetical protein|nr:hypothetical protein [Pseudomonadales bacterium]